MTDRKTRGQKDGRTVPFQVIGTDTDQSATYDFLLVFHSN